MSPSESSQHPSRLHLLLLIGLWFLTVLLVSGAMKLGEKGLALSLLFALLYAFPGYLTTGLFNIGREWSRIQRSVLAMGVGLTEALLLASAAIMLGAPTIALAWTIVLLSALKILWIGLRGWEASAASGSPDRSQVVLAGVIIITLLLLANNLRRMPTYTWRPTDSWNYAQVQVQFSANPRDLHLQPGITAVSVNHRLIWNSWLFNQAMLVDAAQADPVNAIQRDSMYILYIYAALVYVALGRELLQDRHAALLVAFLQLCFVISGTGDYFTERLVEDKFFSYFIVVPLIYMVLLHYLRRPERTRVFLFMFLTTGMALIHPFNPVALFLTAIPFVLYHWIIARDRALVRRTFPVVAWMTLLLAYPLLMQITLVRETEAVGNFLAVDVALEESRNVPWMYSNSDAWRHTFRQLDYLSAYVVTFVIIFIAGLRSRHNPALHFIFAVSAAIVLFLWVPPFAALGARVMTTSQNWRIFMLLPAGYSIGWLQLALWKRIQTRLQVRPLFEETTARMLWNMGIVAVLVVVWNWQPYRIPIRSSADGMTELEKTAFELNREVIGDGRVLAGTRLSRAIPTLWPDANTPLSGKLTALPAEEVARLTAVVDMLPGADPQKAIAEHDIRYLLLLRANPLASTVAYDWPCCIQRYENDEVVLYEVRYDVPTGAVTGAEIQEWTDYQFADFARLEGYSLEESNRSVQIMLYWKPLRQTDIPYTVFVHLVSEFPSASSPIAQDDHPPRLNQTPTTLWQTNSVLRDPYRLDLNHLPDGNYTIQIGIYDPSTLQRISITDGQGLSVGDTLPLKTLQMSQQAQ